jgi:hypothetical protein
MERLVKTPPKPHKDEPKPKAYGPLLSKCTNPKADGVGGQGGMR